MSDFDERHFYEDTKGLIHKCESDTVFGTRLVWTVCNKDVPANKSFKSNDTVTCKKCLKLLNVESEDDAPQDIKTED